MSIFSKKTKIERVVITLPNGEVEKYSTGFLSGFTHCKKIIGYYGKGVSVILEEGTEIFFGRVIYKMTQDIK